MTSLDIKHLDGTAPHQHGVVWMNVPYTQASEQNAERYKVDVDRIAVWGDSSGGHVALLTMVTDGVAGAPGVHDDESWGVRAVIDFYGPTDLALMPQDEACVAVLGCIDPLKHPEAAVPAAATTYIRPASEQTLPPLLVMHGIDDDDVVPFEQSVVLGVAMAPAGHRMDLYQLDGAGHGAGAFFGEPVMDIVELFLKESLDG